MREEIHDVKVVHLAAPPEMDFCQYCLICGKLLSVGNRTYMEGEDVIEERSTSNRKLAAKEYVRCTEFQ